MKNLNVTFVTRNFSSQTSRFMSNLSMKESKIITVKFVMQNLPNQETLRDMSKQSMKESKIINAKSVTRNLAN